MTERRSSFVKKPCPILAIFDKVGIVTFRHLKYFCFNCHSNETSWPWYTSLPMINLLIASDVGEAREYLNFSNWDAFPEDKRVLYLNMVFDEIEHNEMPPMIYKLGHPEAKMTQDDLKILKNTASSLGISFNPN